MEVALSLMVVVCDQPTMMKRVLLRRGATYIVGEMVECRWQRLQQREDVVLKNDHALE